MTEAHTPTAGPYTVERQDEDDGSIYFAVHGKDYDFVTNFHKQGDANLYKEAATIFHEAGLKPIRLFALYDKASEERMIAEQEVALLTTQRNELLRAAEAAITAYENNPPIAVFVKEFCALKNAVENSKSTQS